MRASKNGDCRLALALLALSIFVGCSDKRPAAVEAEVRPVQNEDVRTESPTEKAKTAEVEAVESRDNVEGPALSLPAEEVALADVPDIMVKPPAIAADAKNWPLFRGDSHSSGVAVSKLPEKLEVLWKFRVPDGGFETTPAVVDGVVYIGDFDGKLFAVDAITGEKKWEFAGELGFVASPCVYNGHVYIGDLDGKFYCINAKSGKKIWDFTTDAQIDSSANFYDGKVVVGSQDARLYCLDANQGDLKWKFTIDDQIRCTPTIVENRCFLAGCDGKLHIVDLDKGEAVADVPIESPTGTTPAVSGERVYFGTHAGDFFCIDWQKAKAIWTWQDDAKPSEFRSSAAIGKEQIIVGDRGRRVFALDRATGRQDWEFPTKRNVDSSPVIVGDRVFFGTTDGVLYALNVADGKERWKYEAGGGFIGSPAVADHKLFVASEDGVLYCFGEK